MNPKAQLGLYDRILSSPCYLMNGSYNQCCYIALIKTLCLERQLLSAYLDLTIAKNPYELNTTDSIFSLYNYELVKLHFLNNAITAFNNCYDTVLQIVFFIFEFTPQIFTKSDYEKYVKRCYWENRKDSIKATLEIFTKNHPQFRPFYDKLVDFYQEKGRELRKIANAIKHHGGVASNNTQIPVYGALTINTSAMSKYASLKFNVNDILNAVKQEDADIFSPNSVLPKELDIPNTIELLDNQTTYIYDFVNYLFQYSGLYDATEKQIISTATFHPTFSIINGTEQDK